MVGHREVLLMFRFRWLNFSQIIDLVDCLAFDHCYHLKKHHYFSYRLTNYCLGSSFVNFRSTADCLFNSCY